MGTNEVSNATGEHRVFVYGTLRRGCANQHMLRLARFEGEARTVEPLVMFDLNGRFPGCARGENGGPIVGEVYRVDADTLDRLDYMEGHPHFYRREWLELDDGSHAWVYLLPRERAARYEHRNVIADGDWNAYRRGTLFEGV